jgi:hypothetical protein
VVIINEATPQASTRAVRTTLVGSITPCLIKSQYSPVAALKPSVTDLYSKILLTTTLPSNPALSAIALVGILQAF